jgi:hypothetical protein
MGQAVPYNQILPFGTNIHRHPWNQAYARFSRYPAQSFSRIGQTELARIAGSRGGVR